PGVYNYEVTLTTNDGSVSSSYSDTITIFDPAVADAGDPQVLSCTSTTLQLNGSTTGSGNLIYTWTTNNGNIESGANTLNPFISAPGEYTLTVTNDYNCTSTDTVTVTEDTTPPVANITNNGLELNCNEEELTL